MYILLIFIVLLSSFDIIVTGVSLGINNIILMKRYILIINTFILIMLLFTFFIRKLLNSFIDMSNLKYIIMILLLYLGIKKLYIYIKNRNKDNTLPYINNLSIQDILLLIISLSLDSILICFTNNIVFNNFIFFLTLHFIIENIFLYISNYYSYKLINLNPNTNNLVSSILFLFLGIINMF